MSENQKIKVSIIVPTYNVEKYASQCFDSLLAQTLNEIEIILVDDGSTDTSGDICEAYAKKDSRVRVIHQTNRGLGLTRNSGIEVAKGEYIGFVDSDDIVAKDMFEVLYRNACDEQADISYCNFQKFATEDQIVDEKHHVGNVEKFSGLQQIRRYMLNRVGREPGHPQDNYYGASVCCGIFRRDIFDRGARFLSERQFIAEDMIFDIDVVPTCKTIVHTQQNLYFYRFNPASLTSVYRPDRLDKNILLYHEMYSRLLKTYTKDECFLSMSRYLLTFVRIAIMQEVRFAPKNGKKHTIQAIKAICKKPELEEVLRAYPYWKLPKKYAILCFLEKCKAAELLYFVTKAGMKN